jgi:hypothetical protein
VHGRDTIAIDQDRHITLQREALAIVQQRPTGVDDAAPIR